MPAFAASPGCTGPAIPPPTPTPAYGSSLPSLGLRLVGFAAFQCSARFSGSMPSLSAHSLSAFPGFCSLHQCVACACQPSGWRILANCHGSWLTPADTSPPDHQSATSQGTALSATRSPRPAPAPACSHRAMRARAEAAEQPPVGTVCSTQGKTFLRNHSMSQLSSRR
jgi:hypothetical protein